MGVRGGYEEVPSAFVSLVFLRSKFFVVGENVRPIYILYPNV